MADDMSDAALRDLAELAVASHNDSGVVVFGGQCATAIVRASAAGRQVVARTAVTADQLTAAQTLDEGWAAAVADNLTSVAITLFCGSPAHVTTALSLHTTAPVRAAAPAAAVLVECTVVSTGHMPHSVAVFRDANDPLLVYATVAHTKIIRPGPPAARL